MFQPIDCLSVELDLTATAMRENVLSCNAFCLPNISGSVEQTDARDFQFDTNNSSIPYYFCIAAITVTLCCVIGGLLEKQPGDVLLWVFCK